MTDDLPKATHEGAITVCGVTLKTYVLEDGRRIIDAGDFDRLMGMLASGTLPSTEEMKDYLGFLNG